jgi:uncharacterized protein (DUF697 family)
VSEEKESLNPYSKVSVGGGAALVASLLETVTGKKAPPETPDKTKKPPKPKPKIKPKIKGRTGNILNVLLGASMAIRDKGKKLIPATTGAIKNSKAMKAVKGVGKWAGRLAWPLTVGLTALDVFNILTDESLTTEQKEKELAGVGGGLAGGAAGMVAGATIGSVVPGPGTIIGGLVGAGLGYWGGEALAEKAAERIQRLLKPTANPKPVNEPTPGKLDGPIYIPSKVSPMVRLDASQTEGARVNLLRGQRGMEAAQFGGMMTALNTNSMNAITQFISGPIQTRNDHNTLERLESAVVAFA